MDPPSQETAPAAPTTLQASRAALQASRSGSQAGSRVQDSPAVWLVAGSEGICSHSHRLAQAAPGCEHLECRLAVLTCADVDALVARCQAPGVFVKLDHESAQGSSREVLQRQLRIRTGGGQAVLAQHHVPAQQQHIQHASCDGSRPRVPQKPGGTCAPCRHTWSTGPPACRTTAPRMSSPLSAGNRTGRLEVTAGAAAGAAGPPNSESGSAEEVATPAVVGPACGLEPRSRPPASMRRATS